MSDQPIPSHDGGVSALLARIRDDGVGAARDEAERIVRQANEEAAAIRARARADSDALLRSGREQIAVEQEAGREALRLAARDTLLELRAKIRREFELFVGKLVTSETCDVGFLRDLVLAVSGQLSETSLQGRDLQILLDPSLLNGEGSEELDHALACRALGISAAMLREGIELMPDQPGQRGARVRLVGENLELDLGDEAISRLLSRFLLPRFNHIVEDTAQ